MSATLETVGYPKQVFYLHIEIPSHKEYELTQGWLREVENRILDRVESNFSEFGEIGIPDEMRLKKLVIAYLLENTPLTEYDLIDIKVKYQMDCRYY